jgi:hypothetical protein
VDTWIQVRTVLASEKLEGTAFEEAWFHAMRAISPPRTCGTALRVSIDEDRALLHEAKPHFQAAYEGRPMLAAELERASAAAERRMDELLRPERLPQAA